MTLEEIKKSLRAMDDSFDDDDENCQASIVMLAAVEIGQDLRKLHKFTGISQSRIAKFAHNLRKSGIWRREGNKFVTCANWFEDGGRIDFIADSLVATGMLKRAD